MLKTLKIQNLILIEKVEIQFDSQFNILTGETGAGKSAILSAIQLISGSRADVTLIRAGSSMAIIEAEIDTSWIRRELYLTGKSRCFIDDAQVSLGALKEFVGQKIELVDQSSAQSLCSEELQRSLLDIFSQLEEKTTLFKKTFEEEKQTRAEWEKLSSQDQTRILEWTRKDLDLIEQVNWQQEEEINLEKEHNLCTHAQELKQKTTAIAETLQEVTPLLKKLIHELDIILRLDSSLSPLKESMKISNIELEDSCSFLESYADRVELSSERLSIIEERLGVIENLKRRFGGNWETFQIKKKELVTSYESLLNRDQDLLNLQTKIDYLSAENLKTAKEISEYRKQQAPLFAQQMSSELQSLNLPHAKFEISIKEKPLFSFGMDQIEFLFSANLGAAPLPIHACASGGELSRLFFAMKIILAEQNECSCLVFDEIDGNVGGQTASILGEKLKQLSKKNQVICISHFIQVAKHAQAHFRVYKEEKSGCAITMIQELSKTKREDEYTRMVGQLD